MIKPSKTVAPTRIADIESLNHDGQGVAHMDGKVVFIDGALPRERVEYQPRRSKNSYELGETVAILREASARITPKCAAFKVCGGCVLQHAEPALQVAAKQRVLEDNLQRIGKVTPSRVLPPIYAAPWQYRHRARVSVHYVAKKGGVLVGFREKKSSFVAEMERCEVLAGGVGSLIMPLRQLMTTLEARARLPQIEVAVGENVTALVLRVMDPLSEADCDKLKSFIDAQNCEWKGGKNPPLQWWQQSKGPETAVAWYPEIMPKVSYTLPEFNLDMQFKPTEFTQVNFAVNRLMVKRAIDLLEIEASDNIADLFCGLGNFTLAIARRGASVVGVEGSESLVARGYENAKHNGFAEDERAVSFFAADLYTNQEAAMQRVPKVNKMLIDPPRDGALEVCKLLTREARPELKRIVYVSCSPSTLARDAGVLVNELGWTLAAAGVVNMFPHTGHVESIALFVRE